MRAAHGRLAGATTRRCDVPRVILHRHGVERAADIPLGCGPGVPQADLYRMSSLGGRAWPARHFWSPQCAQRGRYTLGPIWSPRVGQIWPKWAQFGPIGEYWASLANTRPKSDQIRPNSVKLWTASASIGRHGPNAAAYHLSDLHLQDCGGQAGRRQGDRIRGLKRSAPNGGCMLP